MRKIIIVFVAISIFAMGMAIASVEPDWIDNWSKYYPDSQYIAVVGYGNTRSSADKNGMEQLAMFFSTTVNSETNTSSMNVINNNGEYFDSNSRNSFSLDSTVNVSVSGITGVTVKERWDNGKDFYSLVILDKDRAKEYYVRSINNYANSIDRSFLIDSSKLTFSGYYTILSIQSYLKSYEEAYKILSVVSPQSLLSVQGIPEKSIIQNLIDTLAYNLGLSVMASDDNWYKISSDVYSILSFFGIGIMEEDTRYSLTPNLELTETTLPGNNLKFIKYNLDIKIRDNKENRILFSWNCSGREGQTSYIAAEERAMVAIRKKLNNEFSQKFKQAFNL